MTKCFFWKKDAHVYAKLSFTVLYVFLYLYSILEALRCRSYCLAQQNPNLAPVLQLLATNAAGNPPWFLAKWDCQLKHLCHLWIFKVTGKLHILDLFVLFQMSKSKAKLSKNFFTWINLIPIDVPSMGFF